MLKEFRSHRFLIFFCQLFFCHLPGAKLTGSAVARCECNPRRQVVFLFAMSRYLEPAVGEAQDRNYMATRSCRRNVPQPDPWADTLERRSMSADLPGDGGHRPPLQFFRLTRFGSSARLANLSAVKYLAADPPLQNGTWIGLAS